MSEIGFNEHDVIKNDWQFFDTSDYLTTELPLGYSLCYSDDECTNAVKGHFGTICEDCRTGRTRLKNQIKNSMPLEKKSTKERNNLSIKERAQYFAENGMNLSVSAIIQILSKKNTMIRNDKGTVCLIFRGQKVSATYYSTQFNGSLFEPEDENWIIPMLDELCKIRDKYLDGREPTPEEIEKMRDEMKAKRNSYASCYDKKRDAITRKRKKEARQKHLENIRQKRREMTTEEKESLNKEENLRQIRARCNLFVKKYTHLDPEHVFEWRRFENAYTTGKAFSIMIKNGKGEVQFHIWIDVTDKRTPDDYFFQVLSIIKRIFLQESDISKRYKMLKKELETDIKNRYLLLDNKRINTPSKKLERFLKGKQ